MNTYTLKVIDREFKSIQAITQVSAKSRNEALKVARDLQRSKFYNMDFKLTIQTELERLEIERKFNELENY